MPRVGGADDAHHAVPADNLAVPADLLHRCQYFHLALPLRRFIAPRWRATGVAGVSDPC